MTEEEKIKFAQAKEKEEAEWNKVVEFIKPYVGMKVKIIKSDHPWNGYTGKIKGVDKTFTGPAIEVKLSWLRSCYVFSILDVDFI